ncbi:uncharacterized protein G2W53_029114 [Senna tora]|uniref:Uncharacterized protein n=1 Tax=Senna tora TaxID=362788 RepID=A0A834T544_9FABA|nr:uncharacterized protein G2W53_029114 [Senna tora]
MEGEEDSAKEKSINGVEEKSTNSP